MRTRWHRSTITNLIRLTVQGQSCERFTRKDRTHSPCHVTTHEMRARISSLLCEAFSVTFAPHTRGRSRRRRRTPRTPRRPPRCAAARRRPVPFFMPGPPCGVTFPLGRRCKSVCACRVAVGRAARQQRLRRRREGLVVGRRCEKCRCLRRRTTLFHRPPSGFGGDEKDSW